MTKPLSFITLFLFFCIHSATSQEMMSGFKLLENGNYQEAKIFFDGILLEHPNNKTARICQARAMGLSDQKIQALQKLHTLSSDFPSDYEVGLNLAEAFMWNKDFDSALVKYYELLKIDQNNFVAHLGLANAKAGKKENIEALEFINKALELKPGDPSALNSKKYIFIALAYEQALKRNHNQANRLLDSVELIEPNQSNALQIRQLIKDQKATIGFFDYSQSFDNAQNTGKNYLAFQSFSLGAKNRLALLASKRITDNSQFPNKGMQHLFQVQNTRYIGKSTQFDLGIGGIKNSANGFETTNIIGSASLSSKLNAYHFLKLAYHSDYLSYNTELVQSNLRIDNFQLDHHLFSKSKIGLYNSLVHSRFNDGNTSSRSFSSLYYQMKTKPIVKFGVNYSYIHFEQNLPELYFSPDKYQVIEAFLHLENHNTDAKFLYRVLFAHGYQQIENNDWQQILRTEVQLGYKLSKNLKLHVLYSFTNSAQTNALGNYEFQKFGIRLDTHF